MASMASISSSELAQKDLWSRITSGKPLISRPLTRPNTEENSNNADDDDVLSVVPRFAAAQYGRTIHHPRLKQPTPEQENLHLSILVENRKNIGGVDSSESITSVVDDEEALALKLSRALMKGSHTPRNFTGCSSDIDMKYQVGYDNMPSPTSTLCFPEARNNPSYNYDFADEGDFIGTCKFIEFERPQMSTQQKEHGGINLIEEVHSKERSSCLIDSNNTGSRPSNCCGGLEPHFPFHSFVICADTQLGVTSQNVEWETEIEYAKKAIQTINSLDPPPLFVCVCGDLVDMQYSFEENKGYSSRFKNKQECDEVQAKQNLDFQNVFSELNPEIPLVCTCGNHDVSNRPTPASIQRYKDFFGDEYLSFWANGTYNIVLNSVLFANPSGAPQLFSNQLRWLEHQLEYAHKHDAKMIFVYGHHPWFLYDENEDTDDLTGLSPFPKEWGKSTFLEDENKPTGFKDSYFAVPKKYRMTALNLFRKYGVNAAFTGHFHQNVISKSSWGMEHIITSSLSVVFDSSGKPKQEEENGRGLRLVEVHLDKATCVASMTKVERSSKKNEVRRGGTINHHFIPID
mmetsp:Transcript_19591/g.41058  ORF Transcript_19591/g.41058 Transcript_19591/m.41058 type:complete len:573 (-) Transcript_19591:2365-4083(-)